MIAGCVVSAILRKGTFETGLETKNVRTLVTRPDVRYWIAFDSPAQIGFPRCHPREPRASGVPVSGRSSASGAALIQPLQRPETLRVRIRTDPEPRQ